MKICDFEFLIKGIQNYFPEVFIGCNKIYPLPKKKLYREKIN